MEMDRLVDASREGVISAGELVRLGVPERTVYRRCQQDGPWTLLLPATLMLSNGTPTLRQREIAALEYAGPGAVLTGLGAARHHGLRRGGDIEFQHLLVPHARHVQAVKTLKIERSRRAPKPLERAGLGVAPLARCLIDHVRTIVDLDLIAAILTEPVQRRMLLPDMLVVELEAATRKGTAAPRRVLRAITRGVESPAEYEAFVFWSRFPDLPEVRCNVPVLALDGTQIAIVDFLVEELGFVWEVDSVEEHFATPAKVAATAERRRRLQEVGLHAMSTRPSERRDNPAGVLADIRHGLAVAAALPAPRVIYGRPFAA